MRTVVISIFIFINHYQLSLQDVCTRPSFRASTAKIVALLSNGSKGPKRKAKRYVWSGLPMYPLPTHTYTYA